MNNIGTNTTVQTFANGFSGEVSRMVMRDVYIYDNTSISAGITTLRYNWANNKTLNAVLNLWLGSTLRIRLRIVSLRNLDMKLYKNAWRQY